MRALRLSDAGPGPLLIRVHACGACRTDLFMVGRELPDVRPGIVPEHKVVGTVAAVGAGAAGFRVGRRVGLPLAQVNDVLDRLRVGHITGAAVLDVHADRRA
ncbi:alcohol dehydrogenase catalytic domain-containing protein [Chitinivorax sp. PXF-14]|uniref:alcohol dehydrogenase catalytic domain-containing protein n=1 Tax=Chitinivorax sp. PXF-14 TaxID=3230488 RepID=UPI003467B69F